eukprot:UN09690
MKQLMQALQRGFPRVHTLGVMSQKRFVFAFNPTSTPEGLQDYELLYREHDKHSDEARNLLKQNGYLNIISLRNIDNYPLDMNELRDLRYKLNLPFDMWIRPPLFENDKLISTQRIEEILIKIVNGYKTRNKNKNKPPSHKRLVSDYEDDEYEIETPIFYHKKEQKAIIAKPADKLTTIIKPSKQQIDKTYYGDEDKRYQVFGNQWHKKGGKFYDSDDGMDWEHVKFENYEKSQEKTFKDWKEWGDNDYVDEILKPNPMTW